MEKEKASIMLDTFLSFIRVRAKAAGLEINDQVLRLAYYAGKELRTAGVVLGPGVMERGVIKDPQAFAAAVASLRAKVPALKRKGRKMNVVVSLGSANIYTQTFTLPMLSGEELKKAIDLNVQMSSPDDLKKSYHATRVLARNEKTAKLEVSVAFVARSVVDSIVEVLFAAGLVTVSVESQAISIARIARKAQAVPLDQACLLLNANGVGIDVMILRNGELYFEYATSWSEIADPKGQITMDAFRNVITTSLRQVANFYEQRWQDPLAKVVVSTNAFGNEAAQAAADTLGLPVAMLDDAAMGLGGASSADSTTPSEWMVALGAVTRDATKKNPDEQEINLAGDLAAERYAEEHTIAFLELWRILIPATLAICVLTVALAANSLAATAAQQVANAPQPNATRESKISALEASSTAFNRSVQLVIAAESHKDKTHLILSALNSLASTSSVTISRLTFQSMSQPIFLSGVASTQNDIVELKKTIEASRDFTTVKLPLSQIQPSGNLYSFSMTFSVNPGAF